MNYKQQANKLEHFLDETFRKKTPLAVLPDNSLVYKNFKIKATKQHTWELHHISGDLIDTFNIKSTAALAAKFYSHDNFTKYIHVKMLDEFYWNNAADTSFFKYRYQNTKDSDKRDNYLWRFELAQARANNYKDQISSMFKNAF